MTDTRNMRELAIDSTGNSSVEKEVIIEPKYKIGLDWEEDDESENEDESWIDSLDFSSIYVVKGEAGMFIPVSFKRTANGMVCLRKFMSEEEPKYFRSEKLSCLGDYKFHKEDSTKIELSEVFKTIESNLEEIELNEAFDTTDRTLFVKDFSKVDFQTYHARKILKWYRYIKSLYDEMNQTKQVIEEETKKK